MTSAIGYGSNCLLHGPLLMSRIPPWMGRMLRPNQKFIPRPLPKETKVIPRYVRTVPRSPVPELSWKARILKTFADWLGWGGGGANGVSTFYQKQMMGNPNMPYHPYNNPAGYREHL